MTHTLPLVVEVLRVWVDLQMRLYNGGLLFQPRATKFSGRENESFLLTTLTSINRRRRRRRSSSSALNLVAVERISQVQKMIFFSIDEK